jgi:hypothetical protein
MALHYWDNVSRTRSWLEGFAAVGGLEITNHGELAQRYHQVPINSREHWAKLPLGGESLTHWEAGEAADQHEGGHGDETVNILVEWARTEAEQRAVIASLRESTRVFWYQYDLLGQRALAAAPAGAR